MNSTQNTDRHPLQTALHRALFPDTRPQPFAATYQGDAYWQNIAIAKAARRWLTKDDCPRTRKAASGGVVVNGLEQMGWVTGGINSRWTDAEIVAQFGALPEVHAEMRWDDVPEGIPSIDRARMAGWEICKSRGRGGLVLVRDGEERLIEDWDIKAIECEIVEPLNRDHYAPPHYETLYALCGPAGQRRLPLKHRWSSAAMILT